MIYIFLVTFTLQIYVNKYFFIRREISMSNFKSTSKIIAVFMALMMVFSMALAVSAADDTTGSPETTAAASETEHDHDHDHADETGAVTTAASAETEHDHDHASESSSVSNIIGIIVAIILPIAAIVVIIILFPKKNSSKKK